MFAKDYFIAYNKLMKELKPIEESWNKKRVLIGLLVLILLFIGLIGFKTFVLDKNAVPSLSVKGASVSPGVQTGTVSPDIKSTVTDQINTLQKEASNINITDIATSSPQVQKVINDLKSLQDLPKNQAKDYCQQICNSL